MRKQELGIMERRDKVRKCINELKSMQGIFIEGNMHDEMFCFIERAYVYKGTFRIIYTSIVREANNPIPYTRKGEAFIPITVKKNTSITRAIKDFEQFIDSKRYTLEEVNSILNGIMDDYNKSFSNAIDEINNLKPFKESEK